LRFYTNCLIIALTKAVEILIFSPVDIVNIRVASEVYSFQSDDVEGNSLTLGLLYMSEGIGNVVGPYLLGSLMKDSDSNSRKLIIVGFIGTIISSALCTFPSLPFFVWCIINSLRVAFGSTLWIHSTLILQKRVPNEIQGRVFSFDSMFLTSVSIFSKVTVGVLVDSFDVDLFLLPAIASGIGAITVIVWCIFLFKMKSVDDSYSVLSQSTDSLEPKTLSATEQSTMEQSLAQ